jgi:hypothetical protein
VRACASCTHDHIESRVSSLAGGGSVCSTISSTAARVYQSRSNMISAHKEASEG